MLFIYKVDLYNNSEGNLAVYCLSNQSKPKMELLMLSPTSASQKAKFPCLAIPGKQGIV